MADYKMMYYHLAGRVAGAVEALEASIGALHGAVGVLQGTVGVVDGTVGALDGLAESLKKAQQKTEEMFISSGDECGKE